MSDVFVYVDQRKSFRKILVFVLPLKVGPQVEVVFLLVGHPESADNLPQNCVVPTQESAIPEGHWARVEHMLECLAVAFSLRAALGAQRLVSCPS